MYYGESFSCCRTFGREQYILPWVPRTHRVSKPKISIVIGAIIFTNKASFWARSLITWAWSIDFPINRFLQRNDKHTVKVHIRIWGCFSKHGFGILHLFINNLNAKKMLKIYKKALLFSVERWFGRTNQNWILQEDNEPKHRSGLCTQWKEESDINQLD